MFALIDCNNFFVSCERVFRPDLQNKPVAVLSNNDGCIIARSNEVKKMGIPMGAPLFKIKDIIKQNNVVVFSSNFSLYGDLSARVMQTIATMAPGMEIHSIDEAFLECAGLTDLRLFAQQIRERVLQWTGIPTSIGFGPTKVLAKMANFYAKKCPEHQGIFALDSPLLTDHALAHMPVEEIWGIGRKMTAKLHQNGIKTALEFSRAPAPWIRRNFTVMGERLLRELQGTPCFGLEVSPAPRKSIQVTRSFGTPITAFEDLRSAVAMYASRAATRLRGDQQSTRVIMVFIGTNRFQPEGYYGQTATVTLPLPANDDSTFIRAASQGLEQIFRPGLAYKKAGVLLVDLVPETTIQHDLFAPAPVESERLKTISQTMDQINDRYGSGTLHMAACGASFSWRDCKKLKSPPYTTDWGSLPLV